MGAQETLSVYTFFIWQQGIILSISKGVQLLWFHIHLIHLTEAKATYANLLGSSVIFPGLFTFNLVYH